MSPRSRIQDLKDDLSAPSACRELPNGVLQYKFTVKYRLLDRWRTLAIWAPSLEQALAGIDEMKSTLEVEGRLLK
jgi:hypothetical protein